MAGFVARNLFTNIYDCLARTNYARLRFSYVNIVINDFSYDDVQKRRRTEALRSVLFVHNSSADNLIGYCQNFGQIETAHFYKSSDKQYALIEFANSSNVDRLIDRVEHFPNLRRIPMETRCLYFSQRPGYRKNRGPIKRIATRNVDNFGQLDLSDSQLMECKSVDSQMDVLHKKQSLSELDIRLRYFIAAEIERLSKKLFNKSFTSLFGSSVNGLGRYDGDVDINLDIEPDNRIETSVQHNTAYFMSKIRPDSPRTFSQELLETYGSVLKHYIPQMINVKQILRARIPIVKFKHSASNIDGDICISNKEAIEMSRYLYQLFHHHPAVLPLMFTVRQWAKCDEVTKSNPGPWLSNFMLSLLVIFYLQQHPLAILPAIKHLDPDRKGDGHTQITAEKLLLDFFKFYAELDFSLKGISVYQGNFIDKPKREATESLETSAISSDPLYLENPIERNLNAAKNVMEGNLTHFQKSCKQAHDLLSASLVPNHKSPWGVLKILSVDDTKTDDEHEFVPYEDDLDVTVIGNKMGF